MWGERGRCRLIWLFFLFQWNTSMTTIKLKIYVLTLLKNIVPKTAVLASWSKMSNSQYDPGWEKKWQEKGDLMVVKNKVWGRKAENNSIKQNKAQLQRERERTQNGKTCVKLVAMCQWRVRERGVHITDPLALVDKVQYHWECLDNWTEDLGNSGHIL